MAELIRNFDWGTTELGAIEGWSNTLLTTVNMLLASRHPMFLWWGPELIQFYNDGYRPSIRADKHPAAVGQRGVECWPEIWPIIGPQIEAAMTRGDSSWNANQLVPIYRDGRLEEVFWTYSYSPVRDEHGTVQGTLVVCSETTDQVVSERRLRALLGIAIDPQEREQTTSGASLAARMRTVVSTLDGALADLPFTLLFLLDDEQIRNAGSTATLASLNAASAWPLAKVADSRAPRLLTDLTTRFGEITGHPWPEPVTRAYLLPLNMQGVRLRAVMVFRHQSSPAFR